MANDDQPRDEQGRWTETGGGAFDDGKDWQIGGRSRIREASDRLNAKRAAAEAHSSETDSVPAPKAKTEHPEIVSARREVEAATKAQDAFFAAQYKQHDTYYDAAGRVEREGLIKATGKAENKLRQAMKKYGGK